jgi:hypothetical protein
MPFNHCQAILAPASAHPDQGFGSFRTWRRTPCIGLSGAACRLKPQHSTGLSKARASSASDAGSRRGGKDSPARHRDLRASLADALFIAAGLLHVDDPYDDDLEPAGFSEVISPTDGAAHVGVKAGEESLDGD